MAASEAAVAAVHERLGCARVAEICDAHTDLEQATIWTDRGCPVAVAAADAAVDADRASIQAETLRAFAERHRGERLSTQDPIWPAQLDDEADRIEGKP